MRRDATTGDADHVTSIENGVPTPSPRSRLDSGPARRVGLKLANRIGDDDLDLAADLTAALKKARSSPRTAPLRSIAGGRTTR